MSDVLSVEVIRELANMAKASQRADQVQLNPAAQVNGHVALFVPGEPEGLVWVKAPTQAPVQPRNHLLYSVKSFLEFGQRACGGGHGGAKEAVTCFVNAKRATLLLDDGDRRERATLPLPTTERFKFVAGEMAKPKTQDQFLRMLRVDLAGLIDSDELRLACTRLKFTKAEQREGEFGPTADSMGLALRREAVGAANIPELVKLDVPVFDLIDDDLLWSEPIVCAVEIDMGKCTLALTPLPDECREALRLALASVQAKLVHLPCPVYFGAAEPGPDDADGDEDDDE